MVLTSAFQKEKLAPFNVSEGANRSYIGDTFGFKQENGCLDTHKPQQKTVLTVSTQVLMPMSHHLRRQIEEHFLQNQIKQAHVL